MSFRDVSNPQRTARLAKQHQLDRRSRSERIARTSPERTIRIRPYDSSTLQAEIYKELPHCEAEPASVLHQRAIHGSSNHKTTETRQSRMDVESYTGPSLISTATISSTFSSYDEEEMDALNRIRNKMMQRSEFAQLVVDIRHFQTLVKDLETTLKTTQEQTSTSPEAAWKTRILVTSAVETDSAVTRRLMEYEQSLTIPNSDHDNNKEVRTAQSACLKLHRDVQRTHRSLQNLLTKYHQKQQFDIQARLGSVAWSAQQVEQPTNELNQMNRAMHQVNDMMQELAGLVHKQQEPIDQLETNMQQAHDTVESGYRRVSCASAMERPRDMLVCGQREPPEPTNHSPSPGSADGVNLFGCGVSRSMNAPASVVANHHRGFDRSISIHYDDDNATECVGCDWRVQWDNVRNGVWGLKDDLILAGRDLQLLSSSTSDHRTKEAMDPIA